MCTLITGNTFFLNIYIYFLYRAVHVVDFMSDKYRIVSGSDDYSSKIWDIPNGTEISSYQEHTDYVRCGCASKLSDDLFVTGK